jgi:hypothetical protein
MGILAAGLLMAVPLINWSRTLRRLQARPILIYWAIIIFIGYLFVIIGQKETQYSTGWDRKDGGMMTCSTREKIPNFKDLGFITHDFITKYGCDDPCYDPKQRKLSLSLGRGGHCIRVQFVGPQKFIPTSRIDSSVLDSICDLLIYALFVLSLDLSVTWRLT